MLPLAILATILIKMENYTNASNVNASGEVDMRRIVMEFQIHLGHFNPLPNQTFLFTHGALFLSKELL